MSKNSATKVTTGLSWRKPREEGFLVTLPSGNTARLRPVALDVLITSGKLPDLLTPVAASTLFQEQDVAKIGEQGKVAQQYAELINAVVPAAFLSPRIVESPTEDDEISLDDVDFSDKVAVFNLATAGAVALRSFRDRQAAGVGALPDGKGNGDKAKRARRSKRAVDGAAAG